MGGFSACHSEDSAGTGAIPESRGLQGETLECLKETSMIHGVNSPSETEDLKNN